MKGSKLRVESSEPPWLAGSFCRQLVGLAVVIVLASGCDFSPVLDIPLPDHEPGFVLHGVLVADSTVALSLSISRDAYLRPSQTAPDERILLSATVEVDLIREGQVVETLSRRRCMDLEGFIPPVGASVDRSCGPYRSQARIEAGATYTLRVRGEGMPEATATVTVPPRLEVSDLERNGREVTLRVDDPAGLGQHYALQLSEFRQTVTSTYPICEPDGTACRDTTTTESFSYSGSFTTRDPLLLAAARQPGTESLEVVTFDDRAFDGAERAFTIEPQSGLVYIDENGQVTPGPQGSGAVWLIAIDEKLYDAYQVTAFSLGDDNPFEEPSNLPSNVIGGYGLVGAATIHARELPVSPARHAGR